MLRVVLGALEITQCMNECALVFRKQFPLEINKDTYTISNDRVDAKSHSNISPPIF